MNRNKFLQTDGGLSLHATLILSVVDLIRDKLMWLVANPFAPYYKTVNPSVNSNRWSHRWYSASSCYVLRKCVILKCVIQLTVTDPTVDIISLLEPEFYI